MTNFVTYRKSDGRVTSQGNLGKNSSPVGTDGIEILEVETLPDAPAKVVSGEVILLTEDEIEAERFPLKKAKAYADVTSTVDKYRRKFATSLSFQDQAYLNKREEATRYLTDTSQDIDNFPLLKEIAPLRGLSFEEMAQVWVQTNIQWLPILDQTEVCREKALASIRTATKITDLDLLLETLEQNLTNLLNKR